MSLQHPIAIAGMAALLLLTAALPAAAQNPAPQAPSARPRVLVQPRPLLYRRCTSWYEIQHRPSGTVLYPAKHCWWVRG